MNNYETAFWIFLVLFIFAIITIGVLAYEYATEKVLVSKAAFIPTYCQVITNHTAVSGGTEGAKTLLNSDNQISSIGVDVKDASYVCFTPIVPSGSQEVLQNLQMLVLVEKRYQSNLSNQMINV
jgi:hypothetical protein